MAEAEPLAPIVVDGHELPPISSAVNRWVMENLPTCAVTPFYFIVHGQAGCGKSLLLKSIADGVRDHFEDKNSCIVTAPVAVAADLIGGKTIHSTFILPWGELPGAINIESFMNDATENMENLSWMKQSKVLLIDNINNVGAVDFARIDHRLQQVTGIKKPFGGLSVIVFGDFYQVAPVDGLWIFDGKIRKIQEIPNIFNSYLPREHHLKARLETPQSPERLWNLLKIVELEARNWRNEREQQYFDSMRNGNQEEELRQYLNNSCFVVHDQQETLDALMTFYFQNIHNQQGYDFAFLCANNEIAKDLNIAIAEHVRHATILDPTDSNGAIHARQWRLESVNLSLGQGSPVVLLDSCQNIERGAIGRVVRIAEDDITVRFPNGQQVPIRRLEYQSGNRRFQQYPLRLAYAHTIERAQGATFDGIMLVRNHTWTQRELLNWGNHREFHGKLYTAMSRCRNIRNCGIIPMGLLQWVVAPEVPAELARMRRERRLDI